MTTVYKGDDTGAFGNTFITINIENPQEFIISKAIFVCNCIKKVFKNPHFPVIVNFSSEETKLLKPSNICYLVVYDEEGRQKTCTGTLSFNAQSGVICNE